MSNTSPKASLRALNDTLEAIRSIRGCLAYLLVDAENANLECTSHLIRLAIADLDELKETDHPTLPSLACSLLH